MLVSWATWARKAKNGRGVAVAVTGDWGRELPLLCPTALAQAVANCPTTGALVVWVVGADELLLLVPEPPRHGSQTAGVMLPW